MLPGMGGGSLVRAFSVPVSVWMLLAGCCAPVCADRAGRRAGIGGRGRRAQGLFYREKAASASGMVAFYMGRVSGACGEYPVYHHQRDAVRHGDVSFFDRAGYGQCAAVPVPKHTVYCVGDPGLSAAVGDASVDVSFYLPCRPVPSDRRKKDL